MKYRNKFEAKDYAKKNMRGAWGALYVPFTKDLKVDEDAYRHNIRHCVEVGIDGMFLNGMQSEYLALTPAERKLTAKMAVEEAKGKMDIMPQTGGNWGVESTLDLTQHAQDIGADWVIIVNPKWEAPMTEEGVFQYYKYIADRVDIGFAIWNHQNDGYRIPPKLIARMAEELPNFVAIKHGGSEAAVEATRRLCGDKIVVSRPSEDHWLSQIIMYKQEAAIASPSPYLFQTTKLRLIKEYTRLALEGKIVEAWAVNKRLQPIRDAFLKVDVASKHPAANKYWTQFIGMNGGDGRVRLPLLQLTEAEKRAIKEAVESTELVKVAVAVPAK